MFRPSLLLPSDDYRSSSLRRVVCVCCGIVVESGIFLLMALLSWLLCVLRAPSHCWVTLLFPLLLFDCIVGFLGLRQLYVSHCWLLQSERRRRRLLLFSICMRALSTFCLSLVLVRRLSIYFLPLFPLLSYVGGVYLNKQAEDRYSWVRLHAWDLPVLLTSINFCCSARATAAVSSVDLLNLVQYEQQSQVFPIDNLVLAAAAATHLQRLKGTAVTAQATPPSLGTTTNTAVSSHSSTHTSVKVAATPAATVAARTIVAAAAVGKERVWSGAALLWPEFLLCLVMLTICVLLWYLLNADTSLRQDSSLRLSLSFLLHLSASFFLAVIFLAQYLDQSHIREAAAAAADIVQPPLLLAPIITATNTAAAASKTRFVKESPEGETGITHSSSTLKTTTPQTEARESGAAGGKVGTAPTLDGAVDTILPGYLIGANSFSLIPASYWAVPLVFALLLLQLLTAALMVYCIAKHTYLQSPPSSPSQHFAETAALLRTETFVSSLEDGYGASGSTIPPFEPGNATLQQQRPPLVRDMTVSLKRVGHHFYRLLLSPDGREREAPAAEGKEPEHIAAEASAEEATDKSGFEGRSGDLERALFHSEQPYVDDVDPQQQQQHLQQQDLQQPYLPQQHPRKQHLQQQHPRKQHLQQHHSQRQDLLQQNLEQNQSSGEPPQRAQGCQEQEHPQQRARKQGLHQHYQEEHLLREVSLHEEQLEEVQLQGRLPEEEAQQQLLVGAEGYDEGVKRGVEHHRWRRVEAGADQHWPQQQTYRQQAIAAGYDIIREDTVLGEERLRKREEKDTHPFIADSFLSSDRRNEGSAPGEARASAPAVRAKGVTISGGAVDSPSAADATRVAVTYREKADGRSGHNFEQEYIGGEAKAAAEGMQTTQEIEKSSEDTSNSSESRISTERQRRWSWSCRSPSTECREELPAEAENAILCSSRRHRRESPQSRREIFDTTKAVGEEIEEKEEGESKDNLDSKDIEEEKKESWKKQDLRERGEESLQRLTEKEKRETKIRSPTRETQNRENFPATSAALSSAPTAPDIPPPSSAAGDVLWWRPWRYFMPQGAALRRQEEMEGAEGQEKGGTLEFSREAADQGGSEATETQAATRKQERTCGQDVGEDQERRDFEVKRMRTQVSPVTARDVVTHGEARVETAIGPVVDADTNLAATSSGHGNVCTQTQGWKAMAGAEKEDAEESEEGARNQGRINELCQRRRGSLLSQTQSSSSTGRTPVGSGDMISRDSHKRVHEQDTRQRAGRPLESCWPADAKTGEVSLMVSDVDGKRNEQPSQARQAVEVAVSATEAEANQNAGEAATLTASVTPIIAGIGTQHEIHSIFQTEEANFGKPIEACAFPSKIAVPMGTTMTAQKRVGALTEAATATTEARTPAAGRNIRIEEALKAASSTTEIPGTRTTEAAATQTRERAAAVAGRAPSPLRAAAAAATEDRQASDLRSNIFSGPLDDAATQEGGVYKSTTTSEESDLCIICFQHVSFK